MVWLFSQFAVDDAPRERVEKDETNTSFNLVRCGGDGLWGLRTEPKTLHRQAGDCGCSAVPAEGFARSGSGARQ